MARRCAQNEYLWSDRPSRVLARLASDEADDLFCFGHTHEAFHRVVGQAHFVACGSVGCGTEGDARARYAVIYIGDPDIGGRLPLGRLRPPRGGARPQPPTASRSTCCACRPRRIRTWRARSTGPRPRSSRNASATIRSQNRSTSRSIPTATFGGRPVVPYTSHTVRPRLSSEVVSIADVHAPRRNDGRVDDGGHGAGIVDRRRVEPEHPPVGLGEEAHQRHGHLSHRRAELANASRPRRRWQGPDASPPAERG